MIDKKVQKNEKKSGQSYQGSIQNRSLTITYNPNMVTQVTKATKTVSKARKTPSQIFDPYENLEEIKKEIKHTTLFLTYFRNEEESPDSWDGVGSPWSKRTLLNGIKAKTKVLKDYILCEETCPTTKEVHYHVLIGAERDENNKLKQFCFRNINSLDVKGFKHPNIRHVHLEHIHKCISYICKEDRDTLYKGYEPITTYHTLLKMERKELVNNYRTTTGMDTYSQSGLHAFCDKNHLPASRTSSVSKLLSNSLPSIIPWSIDEQPTPPRKLPAVITDWYAYASGQTQEKPILIIRTPEPDKAYELIRNLGNVMKHSNSIFFEAFKLEEPTHDLVVFNQVKTFMDTKPIIDPNTYIEPLLYGKGIFGYGSSICNNSKPVVWIEKTICGGVGIWNKYGNLLRNSLYIEMTNFENDSYDKQVFNDERTIDELNEQTSGDVETIYSADDEQTMYQFMTVRHVHPKLEKITHRLSKIGSKKLKLPLTITKMNYKYLDEYYGCTIQEEINPNDKGERVNERLDTIAKNFYTYARGNINVVTGLGYNVDRELIKFVFDKPSTTYYHVFKNSKNTDYAYKTKDGWKYETNDEHYLSKLARVVAKVKERVKVIAYSKGDRESQTICKLLENESWNRYPDFLYDSLEVNRILYAINVENWNELKDKKE